MTDPQVTLTNQTSGATTDLYSITQNMPSRKSDPRVDSIYSFDSDESFLVSLEEQEQIQLVGTASGNRLSNTARYSSDPQTALAQYAARLLAMVNGNQGSDDSGSNEGYAWVVDNNYTSRSLPCVIEKIDVIRRRTEVFEFDYAMMLRVGRSMMPHEPLDPNAVSISNQALLGGQDLHEIEQLHITKLQKFRTHTYVSAGSGNPQTFEDAEHEGVSGATKEIQIRGNVPGPEADRKAFDDHIRANIGQDKTVVYESAFPGDDINALIANFDSTREGGTTRIGSYSMSLIEGRTSTYDSQGEIV